LLLVDPQGDNNKQGDDSQDKTTERANAKVGVPPVLFPPLLAGKLPLGHGAPINRPLRNDHCAGGSPR
jgi:hypothetical protein